MPSSVLVFIVGLIIFISALIAGMALYFAYFEATMPQLGKCDWCPGEAVYYIKIELKDDIEYGKCCKDCYDISIGRQIMTPKEAEVYKVLET